MGYNKNRIFHLETLMNFLPFFRLILLLFLFSLGSSLPGSFLQGAEPSQRLVWFNFTITDSLFSGLVYPNGGFAQYYEKVSYSSSKKAVVLKKYFNLYEGYSQFWNLMAIICQHSAFDQICLNVQFEHSLSELSLKENLFGTLVLDEPASKVLKLKNKTNIKFYQRILFKEIIEFVLTVLVVVRVAWALFTTPQMKIVNQNFYLQLVVSCVYLIIQGGEYVKESIENWTTQSWKFWIFVPLILMTYKILQDFVYKVMTSNLHFRPILLISSLNLNLYYWGNHTFLFPIMSSMLVFACHYADPPAERDNKEEQHRQKQLYKLAMLLLLINLKLLFKKESCYLLGVSPQYFIIGLMVLFTILLSHLFKKELLRKRKQYQENKLRIKIIAKRTDLSLMEKNEKVNDECAICYEKISSNWAKTPCDHYFHDYCLYQWLEKSQTCPIDRKKILSDQHLQQSQCHMVNQRLDE